MPMLDIFQKSEDEESSKESPKINIIADNREKNSLVISELVHLGFNVIFEQLEVADFLIKDVAIERKTVSDFISSMLNKRLPEQLINLDQYEKKFLLIEGIEEQELYSDRIKNENGRIGVNPNAIRGFLLDIILKYQVPIIFTKNYEDTASFLSVLAKKSEKPVESLRAKRKARNKKEQMQYILEGFPGIGPQMAKKLLTHFKSIKNIINAPEIELQELIGKKSEIFSLTGKEY
jgi:ERCC4-type nuclease